MSSKERRVGLVVGFCRGRLRLFVDGTVPSTEMGSGISATSLFFGFLLQSLLHIHSVILYFPHNPWPCPTTSSRKAFVPDCFHYVSLVVAIVCCHCYPTLFFPTKRTELNEMLHFQSQFLWLFLPAVGIQLSSLGYIKEAFNICYFSSVKILMCGNQVSVWSF